MVRSWFSVALLALSLIPLVDAGGKPVRGAGGGPAEGTPEYALMLNSENAIKLYLAAKGSLSPNDVSTAASALPERRGKHGAVVRRRDVPCHVPDGCVTMAAKIRFLENKFIPGSDNVLSPHFKAPGHQFYSLADPAIVNDDVRMYLLSRPKFAVPDVVRQLLMPEGDEAWPGGAEGDRSPYYPKTNTDGSQFWETDIAPVKGAEGAMPAPPPVKPKKKKKKVVEEEEDETAADVLEMSSEDILDFLIWTFFIMSLVLIPIIILCVVKQYFKKNKTESVKTITSIRNNLKSLM